MVRRGAIIGFGNVAEHGHVPGWLAAEGFAIVAVADPAAERRAAAAAALPGVALYEDYNRLLAQERLDFVDIASPPAFHAAAVSAAAERGLHVLCEKPLTTTRADYLPVRRAVTIAGTVLQPVHNWRCSEAFAVARSVLRDGQLGPLQRIRFETHRNGWAAGGDDWRAKPAIAGGGILVDHGWHTFYLLLGLAAGGQVDSQTAMARSTPRYVAARTERRRYVDASVEDTAVCEIGFDDLVGEIELTWAATERRTRWQLRGERGSLTIEDDQVRLVVEGAPTIVRTMSMSLSRGSHHPEWFPGVIAGLDAEIRGVQRGAGQREAEWCLALLSHAYDSAATGGRRIELEDPERWLAEPET